MADLFKEIIPSLLEKNDYLLNSTENEKSYSPFLVNKAMSQHIDCILYAQNMNINNHLDPKLQYDYYFHSVKRYRRRFQKWHKFNETKDMEYVREYFSCSIPRAREYLSILSKDQIDIIKRKLDKGGK